MGIFKVHLLKQFNSALQWQHKEVQLNIKISKGSIMIRSFIIALI